jgi:hypothetical protein
MSHRPRDSEIRVEPADQLAPAVGLRLPGYAFLETKRRIRNPDYGSTLVFRCCQHAKVPSVVLSSGTLPTTFQQPY